MYSASGVEQMWSNLFVPLEQFKSPLTQIQDGCHFYTAQHLWIPKVHDKKKITTILTAAAFDKSLPDDCKCWKYEQKGNTEEAEVGESWNKNLTYIQIPYQRNTGKLFGSKKEACSLNSLVMDETHLYQKGETTEGYF